MSSESCGSGGCGGCSGKSSQQRRPFPRFRDSAIGAKIAKLPRPLRFIVFLAPFMIIGRSYRFIRQNYLPPGSLLPKDVEAAVGSRAVFGHSAVPVVDANSGAVVGYKFA
eukprot:GILI01035872.1.p1 GENE.GILI01035872.1~~GILI01035872.1.p1  ORF type:complete len:110 (-),score=7.46 GILI01035872.1:56-385(-)